MVTMKDGVNMKDEDLTPIPIRGTGQNHIKRPFYRWRMPRCHCRDIVLINRQYVDHID